MRQDKPWPLVYVAGAIAADSTYTRECNITRANLLGIRAAALSLAHGVPVCPIVVHTMYRSFGPLAHVVALDNTLLDACHGVLVVPENLLTSSGTQDEIERARAANKPVWYTLDTMIEWAESYYNAPVALPCFCPATGEYDPPCPRHGVLGIGARGA